MKLYPALKASLSFFILAAACTSSLHAELPNDVTKILEKSIEATGGREALANIKSSRLTGTFSIQAMGMTGTSEVVQAYPDKVYNKQELPQIGEMVQAYDGEVGWAQDPMQGFRYLSEGEVESLKQGESFADMLDYEEAFSSGEVLSESEIEGEPTVSIKLVSANTEAEETRHYSKESGLLLRVDTVADMGPMGKVPASMNIKEYQEQEGIVYPSLMEMTNAGMLISMTFDSLEINPEIDDALFAAPQ